MKIDKGYVKNTTGLTLAVFGHCIFISLTSMALPMFFTDVIFIDASTVSTIFLITRIWDAINDPLMGSLVDRSKSKWGKCRPFLLYGAIPLSVFTILMFTPTNFSYAGRVAFAFTSYILFITAFTSIDIPLAGMKPLMFLDPDKRNKAQSFSSTFGSLGSLLAIDLFFILVDIFGGGNDRVGYFVTVVTLVIIAFVSLIGGFLVSKEVVPTSKENVPFKKVLKTVISNKFLLIAVCVSVCTIGNSAYQILLPYFSKWNLADMFTFGTLSVEAVLIPILSTATGIVYMVAVMATPYLLKLTDKKKLFIIMSVIGVVANIVSYFCGYDNIILFIIIRIIAHFPPSVASTICGFMIMDCLDYGEYKSGERTEGMTFAVNNFFMKTGNAVFSSALMLLLGIFGYNAAVTAPGLDIGESMRYNYPEMLNGIFILMTIVPAIGLLIQIIPMIFYKLSDKKVLEIVDELKIIREEKEKEKEQKDMSVSQDSLALEGVSNTIGEDLVNDNVYSDNISNVAESEEEKK